MRKKYMIGCTVLILVIVCIILVIQLRVIKPTAYTSEHFNIEPFTSNHDEDKDGIDDQTDILQGAKVYVETRPKYKDKYYATGHPDDSNGVCTDVGAQALLHAGYDLMHLVDQDRRDNPEAYRDEPLDKNIDFRRVRNLQVYFKNNWTVLTNDTQDIEAWRGGDIVVYKKHIGIISDRRNEKGIPLLIHHATPWQFHYEEHVLNSYGEIIGHYRVIKP